MNAPEPAQRTSAALAARHRATQARLERVRSAAQLMHTRHERITAAALARRAEV